jgi:ubiquinone/menaquinone biosynthesis C-methylase UbiE
MSTQEKNNYYDFPYEPLPRWSSYWYQIHEVMQKRPKNILEIGVGNRVVSGYFKTKGLDVTTLDIDESLKPDIVATVTKIPVPDSSYDVVLAAEILEHLPFSDFSVALKEMHRVSREYVVLSLPHWGSVVAGILKIPLIPWLRFIFKLPGFKKHVMSKNGHFWEIGKHKYSLSTVKDNIKKSGFEIIKDYIIIEYPYHHFYILKKSIK